MNARRARELALRTSDMVLVKHVRYVSGAYVVTGWDTYATPIALTVLL